MSTAIADRAGKGLQKQLMISTQDYCEKFDQIFKPEIKPVCPEPKEALVETFLERAKRALDKTPK